MSAINEAASVVLAREAGSAELFLVRRADNLRFFGGFHAFPGGKVGPEDHHLAAHTPGLTGRHVAAVRELFEETGVLLAHRADGSFPAAAAPLAQFRRELLDGRLAFADLLSRLQLSLLPDDLLPVGGLVTPDFSPVRFDTSFYVAVLPPGQRAEVWPGELVSGFWATAGEVLRQWRHGDILVSPPSVALLETLSHAAVEELTARARPLFAYLETGGLHPIWFSPHVLMIPLRCQGLPPSTHTNAFLVGTENLYLLDPGPVDPGEQQRLLALLDSEWRGHGGTFRGVVLTHHHPDHIGAATLCARHLGVPILAHPLTAAFLRGAVEVTQFLNDGDRLDLGPGPHGAGRWHLEAVHTPGHAADHLAFWEPSYRLLFAGDMVSTLSSVVIAPPDGDLAQYIASLERLRQYPARLLLPAHGPPTARVAQLLEGALENRRTREEQLLAALRAEPRPLAELTLELYRGLPANLMRLAEMQTLAGLRKLQREGRAEPSGEGSWRGGRAN